MLFAASCYCPPFETRVLRHATVMTRSLAGLPACTGSARQGSLLPAQESDTESAWNSWPSKMTLSFDCVYGIAM